MRCDLHLPCCYCNAQINSFIVSANSWYKSIYPRETRSRGNPLNFICWSIGRTLCSRSSLWFLLHVYQATAEKSQIFSHYIQFGVFCGLPYSFDGTNSKIIDFSSIFDGDRLIIGFFLWSMNCLYSIWSEQFHFRYFRNVLDAPLSLVAPRWCQCWVICLIKFRVDSAWKCVEEFFIPITIALRCRIKNWLFRKMPSCNSYCYRHGHVELIYVHFCGRRKAPTCTRLFLPCGHRKAIGDSLVLSL